MNQNIVIALICLLILMVIFVWYVISLNDELKKLKVEHKNLKDLVKGLVLTLDSLEARVGRGKDPFGSATVRKILIKEYGDEAQFLLSKYHVDSIRLIMEDLVSAFQEDVNKIIDEKIRMLTEMDPTHPIKDLVRQQTEKQVKEFLNRYLDFIPFEEPPKEI